MEDDPTIFSAASVGAKKTKFLTPGSASFLLAGSLGLGFRIGWLPLSIDMALEWVVLGYTAGAEAIMLLFLTLPGLDGLRRCLVTVIRGALMPLLSVVPFCLFLLADIYWKYETRPSCEQQHACTPSEHHRHQKSIMKSQRNALLIASALLLYWLLFSITSLIVRIDQLSQRVEKLKRSE